MLQLIFDFYGYIIFFYSLTLMISYVALLVMSYLYSGRYRQWIDGYIRHSIEKTDMVPGVSIVAPAYNEEKTIVDNVTSLLKQDYPNFEVVIVNDGSKDKTLELLIENFDMEEVPYAYTERIHCQPFRRLFKSKNPAFKRLVVVDKVNGGTKADAVNAGLNVVSNAYFINTDVDCILSRDAITQCIFPVLQDENIIAVSGTMSMSNGSEIEDGVLVKRRTPNRLIPLFQDLEYKRSFLVGKMGWAYLNAMNNVSGGYGLFSTKVCIEAGGYGYDSFAEDMDMIFRMIAYCCETKQEYRVVQIPHTCCWTEGPSTIKVLNRQRTRWGRGLIQHVFKHFHMLLNPTYRRLGMITFPYVFLFEFLAPVIEAVGLVVLLYLIFTDGVNWQTFWVVFFAVYFFSVMLSGFVIFYDYISGGSYTRNVSYLKLVVAAILEPFLYHPLITFFSIKGYYNYLTGAAAVWGEMTRTGVQKKKAG